MEGRKNKRVPKHPSCHVARPERFELPTPKFVAWCSIQLSYGRKSRDRNRVNDIDPASFRRTCRRRRAIILIASSCVNRFLSFAEKEIDLIDASFIAALSSRRQHMAEREGFEPSIELLTLYSLSRGAPSASRASLRFPASATCLHADPSRWAAEDTVRSLPGQNFNSKSTCRRGPAPARRERVRA